MKTKIIFTITSLSIGGAERVFSTLLKNIDRNKFEIILAVGVKTDGFFKELPSYIRVFELSGTKRAHKSFYPLLKLILNEKPDIVFSTLGMVSSSALCSFFTGKRTKYIARFGNTLSADLNRSKRESYFKYKIQKIAYRLVLARSQIVAQSEYMKNDLIDYFSLRQGEKICVIYNPCPKPNTSYTGNPSEKTLVTVGRFAWQKGYDILIGAIKLLSELRGDFKFYFIGGGDNIIQNSVKEKSNQLGLMDTVSFMGEREHPFCSVDNIDIFVSSSRFEGFANVIVESLANGIPVVATDCPSGNREIVNVSNGWLTKQKGQEPTANELCKTMNFALDNVHNLERNDIKQEIQNRFSIEKIVSQYEQLFLEIRDD